ncbi:MAG: GMC family oxidoreductase [Terriglobia bacterium]|jgi:choline dehydrogenase-like flavoprotein
MKNKVSNGQEAAGRPKNEDAGKKGLDRREALSRLLGVATAATAAGWLPRRAAAAGPALQHEPSHWAGATVSGFFTDQQKFTVSALAQTMIPDDAVAPGAYAAQVKDYLEFVMTHAEPAEQRAWTEGLKALDQTCSERFGKAFAAISLPQRTELLTSLAAHEAEPKTPAEKFFVQSKQSVATGYYTSKIGLMDDLKYKGNRPNDGVMPTCDELTGKTAALPSHGASAPAMKHEAVPDEGPPNEVASSNYRIVPAAFVSRGQSIGKQDLDAITKETYDVCIVGSGASGGIAAKELTEKGLRVVVLEAGTWVSPARFKTHIPPWELPFRGRWKSHGENDYTGFLYVKNPVVCPEEPIDYALLPAVGGKTLTWARISWRFGEKDFKNRGIGDDWPFGYQELAPYYDRAETFMGVAGAKDGLAAVPDGHFIKPLELRCGEKMIREACRTKMGADYHVIALRKAVNTVTYGGRPPCHYCGYCMRGCDINAAYSSANAAIPAAEKTGRLTLVRDAIVRELEVDATGKRCSGAVFIDRHSKKEYRVRARAYALACGGVEDVRILLMSKSKDYPQGLANSSGWVGRNLVSEHYDGAVGYIERLLGAKVMNEDGADEHGEIPNFYYERPSKNFARGYMIDLRSGPVQIPSFAADVPGFGEKYREEVRRIYPAMVYLGAHGEMLANEKSYVDLDPVARDQFGLPKARMHLEWGENELAMVRDEREKCRAIIEAAGGKVLAMRSDNMKPHFDGENLVGTVRMGSDPKRSVLDPTNRSHDVKNLWVLDGASFTSYSEKNPTLTVVAVAIRASDHLAEALRTMET